jgi:hypothetical protein
MELLSFCPRPDGREETLIRLCWWLSKDYGCSAGFAPKCNSRLGLNGLHRYFTNRARFRCRKLEDRAHRTLGNR